MEAGRLTDDSRSYKDKVENSKKTFLQIRNIGPDLPEGKSSKQANDDVKGKLVVEIIDIAIHRAVSSSRNNLDLFPWQTQGSHRHLAWVYVEKGLEVRPILQA
jgi:hypothetical protein